MLSHSSPPQTKRCVAAHLGMKEYRAARQNSCDVGHRWAKIVRLAWAQTTGRNVRPERDWRGMDFSAEHLPEAPVAAPTDGRKPPPRLRKPSPEDDTGALEGHRARLREAFGNTLSDEFV